MKEKLLQEVQAQQAHLYDLSCQILEFNEIGGTEHRSAKLLADELEANGFTVERGIGNQETSFRAVWRNGEGGPNIGILGEYDALPNKGHACGHHFQGTAAVGAAIAIRKIMDGSDKPFTLTVYGTPAEETYGGKIIMQEAGCFQELDVALGTHATRGEAFVGGSSLALTSFAVTYKGISAHASGTPWMGRSAMDAMLLSFQGLEFLREHVKDGTRMHYSIKEAIGPTNVVPERAVAGFTLRTRSNEDLPQLIERFKKVIEGATHMTETTFEMEDRPIYLARKRNDTLTEVAKANFRQLNIPHRLPLVVDSGGSTDFGNVSGIVPGIMIYLPFVEAPAHSQVWLDNAKTEAMRQCLLTSTQMLVAVTYDLTQNPDTIAEAKQEFDNIK